MDQCLINAPPELNQMEIDEGENIDVESGYSELSDIECEPFNSSRNASVETLQINAEENSRCTADQSQYQYQINTLISPNQFTSTVGPDINGGMGSAEVISLDSDEEDITYLNDKADEVVIVVESDEDDCDNDDNDHNVTHHKTMSVLMMAMPKKSTKL